MGRRIITLERPGTAGMAPDLDERLIGPQHAELIQDGYVGNVGLLHQRLGWANLLTSASGVVHRNLSFQQFQLSGNTLCMTTVGTTAGSIYRVALLGGTATSVIAGAGAPGEIIHRCSYHDQAVFCYQDGLTPAFLYSGSLLSGTDASGGGLTYVSGGATVTLASATPSTVDRGTYVRLAPWTGTTDRSPTVWVRVLERNSTTSLTMEDIKSTGSNVSVLTYVGSPVGYFYPNVSVYEASTGTLTASPTNTFVGLGTKWFSGSWGNVVAGSTGDSLIRIVPATGGGRAYAIVTVDSDTQLGITNGTTVANAKYHIARRWPMKDSEVWNQCLWGAGCFQHKNRVYVLPPGTNPSLPPGYSPLQATSGVSTPFDPGISLAFTNPEDFLADFIPVPADDDDDEIVAIRATPFGYLEVMKHNSRHGIWGNFPDFRTDLLRQDVGCMDIRSAWTFDIGTVACDGNGIWLNAGQGHRNIAEEAGCGIYWRNLADGFHAGLGDTCATGFRDGHLFVSIDPRVSSPHTLVFDMRGSRPIFLGEWTNHQALSYANVSMPGIALDGFYWVGTSTADGQIANSGPILDSTGVALDGDAGAPILKYRGPHGLARKAGIDVEARLTRVRVDANFYDAAGAGSNANVIVYHQGRFDDYTAETGMAPGQITSGTGRVVKPYRFDCGVKALEHQVVIEKTATAASNNINELHRIMLDFRTQDRSI